MKYIENVEVFGWNAALRGMRNPKNSWDKNDSVFAVTTYPSYTVREDGAMILSLGADSILTTLGKNDKTLAKALTKAGPEHRKFLRMIHVQFDLTLPRYVWSEFDTYHHNVKNSCSTMHKLFDKKHKLTLDDFIEPETEEVKVLYETVIDEVNRIADIYFNTPLEDADARNKLLRAAKQMLPEGYLQKRTVDTTYEELRNIYRQRKNHRLPEWKAMFEELLPKLPYYNEFITDEDEKDELQGN